MPHTIGFVDDSNGQLAHYNMLQVIRDFAAANGWQVLRYDTTLENRELILKGVGYSGTEEIFVGFRTYHNIDADYYNLVAGGFTGYVPGNDFDHQPGAALSGVPCHNQRVDYWLTLNPQRIALAMKVGTPVYESCYVGKMLPYARPSQYPYPVICAGMLNGVTATRFSETKHSIPYKGNRANFRMRFNDGIWRQVQAWPYNNDTLAGTTQLRETNGIYPLNPIILMDAQGVYGELDGIRHIPGFNNRVENTLQIGTDVWIVVQDVWRTGFNDYYAIKMD